jgi:chemotaxis protein MotD
MPAAPGQIAPAATPSVPQSMPQALPLADLATEIAQPQSAPLIPDARAANAAPTIPTTLSVPLLASAPVATPSAPKKPAAPATGSTAPAGHPQSGLAPATANETQSPFAEPQSEAQSETSAPSPRAANASPSSSTRTEPAAASLAPVSSTAPPPSPALTSLALPGVAAFAPEGVDAPVRLASLPNGFVELEPLFARIAHRIIAGDTRFEIRLDPPELGRIEVRLDVDRNGQAQTQLSAERPQTLELLQRDSAALERALKDAGLDSNSLSFSLKGDGRQAQGHPSEAARAYGRDGHESEAERVPAELLPQATLGAELRLDIRV